MALKLARRGVLAMVGGTLAAMGEPRPAAAQDTSFFRIGTGSAAGTYFQIGEVLASAISNPPGSRKCEEGGSCGIPGLLAAAQSSDGSVANVLAIADGSVESAFAQADVAFWAYTGAVMFGEGGRIETLRTIANLFSESVHLVARTESGIATIADLEGKRVSLNEEGSGTLIDARHILAANGLGDGDFTPSFLSTETAIDALAAGEIDAFFYIAGFPTPAVVELAERIPILLLPINGPGVTELLESHPFFNRDFIPTATYRGVATTETLSVGALWLVSSLVPDDLVYGITQAMWTERTGELLATGHPKGRDIKIDRALTRLVVPLHPGAERYYRERGLITQP